MFVECNEEPRFFSMYNLYLFVSPTFEQNFSTKIGSIQLKQKSSFNKNQSSVGELVFHLTSCAAGHIYFMYFFLLDGAGSRNLAISTSASAKLVTL